MRVVVHTDDGQEVGEVIIDSHNGPWTDDWQCTTQYEFNELANEAARMEGGE